MKRLLLLFVCLVTLSSVGTLVAQTNYNYSEMQREKLGRGLVAVRVTRFSTFVSWRYLSSDPIDITFNVYANGVLKKSTSKTSARISGLKYEEDGEVKLVPVIGGTEQEDMAVIYTLLANSSIGYIEIPLTAIPDSINQSGAYSYSPNDASVGDVDGDGEFEIFLKWDPSNSKDNSQSGYTGNVYIDCYKLNGTHLWRINLGHNIRAGAHYTQFMVYDLDGDGKAELVCKTADGTIDGTGKVIGDASKDYRNTSGYVLSGPEYLTIFDGATGAELKTTNYLPVRGTVSSWGDDYGNRLDRYLACIAYLDGKRPSVVMCRGYYTRTVLVAWDWDGENLTRKWTFDSNNGYTACAGQGNHNLRVGDIDSDGKDEIVYGSLTIDHDGKPKYNTRLGHGDAIHMTVFDPASGALAVWACHEDKVNGSTFRDAATGKIIKQIKSSDDVGRCMAADIDPGYPGVEMWSSRSGGILSANGEVITTSTGGVSMNMACWWDGRLLRNLQNDISITRFNYSTRNSATTLLSPADCASNNSTKANPCLVADMYGDWREELMLRTSDNKALRIFINTDSINYRFHTFLEDPVYRSSVAYQNVAYNQPTHTGFYFGADLGNMLKTVSENYDSWTLDAGMTYDSYRWMLGDTLQIGTERSVEVSSEMFPEVGRARLYLYTTYRGYEFKEFLTLSRPTSVEETSNLQAVKFPTEVRQLLTLELPEGVSSCVSVYAMDGTLVASVSDCVAQVNMDASSWSQGIYVVKVVTSTATISRKVVKR